MRRISVGDVMTRNFVSVKPDANLHDCAKKLIKERIHSLVVAEGGRLVGILNSRDVIWAVTKNPGLNLKKVRAVDVASKKVAVIKPSADISQAIKKMRSVNFRRLPVLSKGILIGVVTLKDILAIDPSFYSEVTELTDVREAERKFREAGVEWPLEGMCDNCGAFSELLRVEGELLCLDCRDELH
jgi:CBS domain-containing protein